MTLQELAEAYLQAIHDATPETTDQRLMLAALGCAASTLLFEYAENSDYPETWIETVRLSLRMARKAP